LYLNGDEVQTIPFSEDNSLNKIDFSVDLNDMYTSGPAELSIELNDYNFDSNNNGFRLSTLFQVDYINRIPPSAEGAPILFSITNDHKL
jgi:hypothetical protein